MEFDRTNAAVVSCQGQLQRQRGSHFSRPTTSDAKVRFWLQAVSGTCIRGQRLSWLSSGMNQRLDIPMEEFEDDFSN